MYRRLKLVSEDGMTKSNIPSLQNVKSLVHYFEKCIPFFGKKVEKYTSYVHQLKYSPSPINPLLDTFLSSFAIPPFPLFILENKKSSDMCGDPSTMVPSPTTSFLPYPLSSVRRAGDVERGIRHYLRHPPSPLIILPSENKIKREKDQIKQYSLSLKEEIHTYQIPRVPLKELKELRKLKEKKNEIKPWGPLNFIALFNSIKKIIPGLIKSLMRILLFALPYFESVFVEGIEKVCAQIQQPKNDLYNAICLMDIEDPIIKKIIQKKELKIDEETEMFVDSSNFFLKIENVESEEGKEVNDLLPLITNVDNVKKINKSNGKKNFQHVCPCIYIDNKCAYSMLEKDQEDDYLTKIGLEFTYQIMVKEVSVILLFLIKFSHRVDRFHQEVLCQSVNSVNGILILLKYFNLDLKEFFLGKDDGLLPYPYIYLPYLNKEMFKSYLKSRKCFGNKNDFDKICKEDKKRYRIIKKNYWRGYRMTKEKEKTEKKKKEEVNQKKKKEVNKERKKNGNKKKLECSFALLNMDSEDKKEKKSYIMYKKVLLKSMVDERTLGMVGVIPQEERLEEKDEESPEVFFYNIVEQYGEKDRIVLYTRGSTILNLLRVFEKLVKNFPMRLRWCVYYKTHNIFLKRIFSSGISQMQIICMRVMKEMIKYMLEQWLFNNMIAITFIYINIGQKLNDEYMIVEPKNKNEVEKDLDSEMVENFVKSVEKLFKDNYEIMF
jgi:hypothetical protein